MARVLVVGGARGVTDATVLHVGTLFSYREGGSVWLRTKSGAICVVAGRTHQPGSEELDPMLRLWGRCIPFELESLTLRRSD